MIIIEIMIVVMSFCGGWLMCNEWNNDRRY